MPKIEVTVQQMPPEALPEALYAQKVVVLVTNPTVAGWDGPDLPEHRRVGSLTLTDEADGGMSIWFMRALPPVGPRGGPLAWEEVEGAVRHLFKVAEQPGFAPAKVWRVPAGRRGTYATGAVPPHGNPRTLLETIRIGRFAVKAFWEFDDITIQAAGFALRFPEKPNTPFVLVKRGGGPASELLNRPDTMQALTDLGERWRKEVQARIRRDWGERCFVPDAKGYYQHPLFAGARKRIHCVHCERKFPAAAVAANLWHCPDPDCNGSPIDMQ